MCALLIVMIIIIVVSGIIVFGVIITVKYYNEEDVDKIGPALCGIHIRIVMLVNPWR
jgi:membrane-anchored glycerophosphoryl diester phosphodiesterase (GDPDase)